MDARAAAKSNGRRRGRNGATVTPEPIRQIVGDHDPGSTPEDRAEILKRRLLRLALDVHDGPMQNLAVIGFSLSGLKRRIETVVPPEHRQRITANVEQIASELGRVDEDLRSLISELEDGGTQSTALLEAIETEIRDFEKNSPAEVVLVFDRNARAETDSQRIALQSVARAALTNVAKHADAENVTVRVHAASGSITLEIEDDGKGFAAGIPAKDRFGLAGMKERVELLGGEFRISSRPGGPTVVTATLLSWRPPQAG